MYKICPLKLQPFQRHGWGPQKSGWFVILGLKLVMINLPAKYEVFIYTLFEDMNGNTKCGKWCGLG